MGPSFAKMRFVERFSVGRKNPALLGGDDQGDLHALAATAPPTAARRDEGKNVSCGKSFVKAESSQLQTAPLLSGIARLQ
jgi:hypothetical protein